MGSIAILNQRGDEKIEWNPANEAETAVAKEKFDKLKKDGYEFFETVDAKGKQVKRFKKGLGKLIAAPAAKQKAKGNRGMAGGPNITHVGA